MQGITNLFPFDLQLELERKIFISQLSLLRSATINDALSNEKQRMLSNLLCESKAFIKEP